MYCTQLFRSAHNRWFLTARIHWALALIHHPLDELMVTALTHTIIVFGGHTFIELAHSFITHCTNWWSPLLYVAEFVNRVSAAHARHVVRRQGPRDRLQAPCDHKQAPLLVCAIFATFTVRGEEVQTCACFRLFGMLARFPSALSQRPHIFTTIQSLAMYTISIMHLTEKKIMPSLFEKSNQTRHWAAVHRSECLFTVRYEQNIQIEWELIMRLMRLLNDLSAQLLLRREVKFSLFLRNFSASSRLSSFATLVGITSDTVTARAVRKACICTVVTSKVSAVQSKATAYDQYHLVLYLWPTRYENPILFDFFWVSSAIADRVDARQCKRSPGSTFHL